ncbi:glucose-1-phosphatase-like [Pieris brassicae]|uniref:Glucose-1-phosphatase n=1 Tax=Pieris brassicae TaxID=7116 RepID=A0A9P0TR62_PIEBR|nr:glucose-1-phosphatase-like [Pieris brassicae]CAH4036284.1 unnamed protein product [Pieris brassicae]
MSARQKLCLSIGLFLCFTLCLFIVLIILDRPVNQYQLEKVIILSRHNLRTPLSKDLDKITPLSWPKWKEEPGYLTEKGFVLEGYMGSFFKYWLNSNDLLLSGCPKKDEFYVYSNNMQRTLMSSKAFITKAFPGCEITIHQSTKKYDPVFSPFIHNNTDNFRNIAIEEMDSVLESLILKSSYNFMENILDYQTSELCKIDKKCDMATEKNLINITVGRKPSVTGPIKLCNMAIDAFFMEYYGGLPIHDIAWGKLSDMTDWNQILPLTYGYHNVTFNTTHVAKDIAKPLLKYLYNLFIQNYPTVTLLMGHDANINVLLNAMDFKPFILKNEFVPTPIGGKLVFQKWKDLNSKKFLLKINYVYQSIEQIRKGTVLSKNNPPMFQLLELKNCKANVDGFCDWDEFLNFLHTIVLL